MKKQIKLISVIVLGCCAVAANAKPVTMSFKAVPVAENSAELSRIEMVAGASTASIQDSTQLKIMGSSASRMFSGDPAAASILESMAFASRARPVLITQAMTMPAAQNPAAPMAVGAQTMMPFASGPAASAAPDDNDVLIVSEPPMLLLITLGMILAGIRRKA